MQIHQIRQQQTVRPYKHCGFFWKIRLHNSSVMDICGLRQMNEQKMKSYANEQNVGGGGEWWRQSFIWGAKKGLPFRTDTLCTLFSWKLKPQLWVWALTLDWLLEDIPEKKKKILPKSRAGILLFATYNLRVCIFFQNMEMKSYQC